MMNKPKIFICGNFGYKNNQIDGQTVKTRQLKGVLIKKLSESNVAYVDTSYSFIIWYLYASLMFF